MATMDLGTIRAHLRHVVIDYCEYSGISCEKIADLVNRGPELARREWYEIVKSGSDEEILEFYAKSKYYIYEVLQPYLEPEKYNKDINYLKILRFAEGILRKKGRCKVLEFGAGVGELCILLAKLGCDVTYSDLPGTISDFAKWRFKKHGVDISIIYSGINDIMLPLREYDLIVSDAVIEHLKREYLENFVRALANALVDRGYIYLLWDPKYTEDYPYHILGMRARELDRILSRYSLVRISDHIYVKSAGLGALLRHILWLFRASYAKSRNIVRKHIKKLLPRNPP